MLEVGPVRDSCKDYPIECVAAEPACGQSHNNSYLKKKSYLCKLKTELHET